jgi:hypothetical protein
LNLVCIILCCEGGLHIAYLCGTTLPSTAVRGDRDKKNS